MQSCPFAYARTSSGEKPEGFAPSAFPGFPSHDAAPGQGFFNDSGTLYQPQPNDLPANPFSDDPFLAPKDSLFARGSRQSTGSGPGCTLCGNSNAPTNDTGSPVFGSLDVNAHSTGRLHMANSEYSPHISAGLQLPYSNNSPASSNELLSTSSAASALQSSFPGFPIMSDPVQGGSGLTLNLFSGFSHGQCHAIIGMGIPGHQLGSYASDPVTPAFFDSTFEQSVSLGGFGPASFSRDNAARKDKLTIHVTDRGKNHACDRKAGASGHPPCPNSPPALCKDYLTGACRNNQCKLYHPTPIELLSFPAYFRGLYKKYNCNLDICRDYLNKKCDRELCRFYHPPAFMMQNPGLCLQDFSDLGLIPSVSHIPDDTSVYGQLNLKIFELHQEIARLKNLLSMYNDVKMACRSCDSARASAGDTDEDHAQARKRFTFSDNPNN